MKTMFGRSPSAVDGAAEQPGKARTKRRKRGRVIVALYNTRRSGTAAFSRKIPPLELLILHEKDHAPARGGRRTGLASSGPGLHRPLRPLHAGLRSPGIERDRGS